MFRTHTCGELRKLDVGKNVKLAGWVDRIRDLGGIKFILLRDRYGIVQLVITPDSSAYEVAKDLDREDVIGVEGIVRERPPETVNPDMETGEIEVYVENINVFSKAKNPPFFPGDEVSEELRLKYRYIDMRKGRLMRNLILRHRVTKVVRDYLDSLNFVEVETPDLTRSTPEGARDFLVPSRIKPGKFYALPQSPQLFKQILMVGGLDRYYQIARCFRDEDLRADRQPEFTQIDIEMSFVEREDVLRVVEGMMARIFSDILGIELKTPFDRLSFDEAMERYGSDKPDRRYGMELLDFTDIFSNTSFRIARDVVESGGKVKGFVVKGFGDKMSRRLGDELSDFVKDLGLGGIIWFAWDGEPRSPFKKHLLKEFNEISGRVGLESGDVVLIAFERDSTLLNEVLGELRLKVGKEYFPERAKGYDILWVLDFPFLEWSEDENRWVARHHPFTMPVMEDLDRHVDDPGRIKAHAYDIILNGYEIGGGSIRIHNRETQERVFELIGLSREEAWRKFGFLMEAFEYGAPPHGGIALGLDRIVAILAGEDSIRDVMAFPKTSTGSCLLTGAPSDVSSEQLKELKIKVEVE